MKPEAAQPENTPSYGKLCLAHAQWAVAGQLMLLRPQAVQLCALRAASRMQCVHAHLTEPEQGCCQALGLQRGHHTPGCQVLQCRLVLPV